MKQKTFIRKNSNIKRNSTNDIFENFNIQENQIFKQKIYNDELLENYVKEEDYSENKNFNLKYKNREDLKESLLCNSNNSPKIDKINPKINEFSNLKVNNKLKNNLLFFEENYPLNKFITSKSKILSNGECQCDFENYNNSKQNFLGNRKKIEIEKDNIWFYFYKLRGYIYILFGCFLATIVNFLSKFATMKDLNPITLLFYRGIFLAIYSIIYLFLNFNELKNQFVKDQYKSLLIRGLMNSVGVGLVLISLNYLRLNTLELLLRTGNLMSVFVGYYFLNEVVTKWDLLSLFGTFFGIIFILKPNFIFGNQLENNSHSDSFFGIILAITCAFIIAIANVLSKQLLTYFHEIYLLIAMAFCSIILGIILLLILKLSFSIEFFFLIYVSFVTVIDFFALYYTLKSLKYESVTKISPFFNSRIVFSVIITYLYYGQIDFYDLLGSTIILSIYIYSSYKKIH